MLSTTKPDKYDRYLADLFVLKASAEGTSQEEQEIFLNNALLENRHAVRYDGGAKEE